MHLFAHLSDCIPDSIPGERGAALCGVIKKGWGARQSVCWCAVRAGVVPPCAVATSLGSARAHLFQTSTGLLSLVLVSFRHNQVRSENVCWSLCVAASAGRPSLPLSGSCIVWLVHCARASSVLCSGPRFPPARLCHWSVTAAVALAALLIMAGPRLRSRAHLRAPEADRPPHASRPVLLVLTLAFFLLVGKSTDARPLP